MSTPTDTNPGPATSVSGNTQSPRSTFDTVQTIAVNFGTVGTVLTITSTEKTLSGLGTGILAGDVILSVSKPTTQAGLGIVGWRNDSATNDKFYVTYMNTTAATITVTASETYLVTVGRFNSSTTTTPGTLSSVPSSVSTN